MIKARGQGFGYAPADATIAPCRLDVLPWLARATLDVIGEAGFGYAFNALEAAAERRESESELARAFGVIFGTARKFRVMTILQVWFPVLRAFVSGDFVAWARGWVLTLFVLCFFSLIENRETVI